MRRGSEAAAPSRKPSFILVGLVAHEIVTAGPRRTGQPHPHTRQLTRKIAKARCRTVVVPELAEPDGSGFRDPFPMHLVQLVEHGLDNHWLCGSSAFRLRHIAAPTPSLTHINQSSGDKVHSLTPSRYGVSKIDLSLPLGGFSNRFRLLNMNLPSPNIPFGSKSSRILSNCAIPG